MDVNEGRFDAMIVFSAAAFEEDGLLISASIEARFDRKSLLSRPLDIIPPGCLLTGMASARAQYHS
jgi:hypothetical protein